VALVGGAVLGSLAVSAGLGAQAVLAQAATASDGTTRTTTGDETRSTPGHRSEHRSARHVGLVAPAHGHRSHATSKGS
jgi:hypothetical protein